jgi:hypothetical protein
MIFEPHALCQSAKEAGPHLLPGTQIPSVNRAAYEVSLRW